MNKRDKMTVRILPLHSQEGADARVEGSPTERLALVAELSRRSWALTGKATPVYTRQTIPFQLIALVEQ